MSHAPTRPTTRAPPRILTGCEVGCQSNAARVEEPRAVRRHEVEQAAAFLEETAPLGKEQRKPVERDLLLVGLHLGEVGVQREVEREIARKRIANVDARPLATSRLVRADAWRHTSDPPAST